MDWRGCVSVLIALAVVTGPAGRASPAGQAACPDAALSVALVTATAADGLVTAQAGTVVSTAGDVLTQWSWLKNARRFVIALPGQAPARARLLGASDGNDLVLLRPVSPVRACPVSFGDASAIRAGQPVQVSGYPFAGRQRSGFVAAENGTILETRGAPARTFRSDLVVDPGFAGSPILDAHGRAIGIQHIAGGRAVWRDIWTDSVLGLPVLIDRLERASPASFPVQAAPPVIARRRAAGRQLTIAVHASLSGQRAAVGRSILDGAAQAVSELSAAFQAHGIQVRLTALDDRGDPAAAVANIRERLLNDPSVLLVVSHNSTGVCQDAARVYEEAGLPSITPACEVASFTDGGLRTVFRVIGRDDAQGAAAARFARSAYAARTAYVAYEPGLYGLRTAAAFWWEAKRLGIRVAGLAPVAPATLRAASAAAANARPDVVYYGGEAPGAARFLRALRSLGVRAVFLGPDGLDSSEFRYFAGPDGTGTIYTILDAPPRLYPAAGTFADHVRTRVGHEPGPFAALAYDAVGVGLEAVARASMGYRRLPTREEVLTALHEPSLSFRGVTGIVRFMTNGDRMDSPVFVMRVTGATWTDWPNNMPLTTIIP